MSDPSTPGQVLTAQDGGSNLVGGAGADTLVGAHGPDSLTGGGGADVFRCGFVPWSAGQVTDFTPGPDTLTGGGGADVFRYGTIPWSAGHVTDFTPGTDKLDLSGLLRQSGYAGADPIADGYVRLLDDGHGDTWLYYDTDGRGSADAW